VIIEIVIEKTYKKWNVFQKFFELG